MGLHEALAWVARGLSVALLLQSAETFSILSRPAFTQIWNLKNLKGEIPQNFLFSDHFLKLIMGLLFVLSLISFGRPSFGIFLVMAGIQLLIGIRFRGVFNGGSDMMTFVLLTGLLISFSSSSAFRQELGLLYIAIHTLYSYFKAGWVKFKRVEWRTGSALPAFADRSLYSDVRSWGKRLDKEKLLSRFLAYLTLAFELSIFIILFFPKLVWFYFAAAVLFHLLVYVTFGLNRFFWVWLSAWPAVIFATGLLARPSLG